MDKNTSIFTQIINGDIPSHKVYEDEKVIVFMDIHPIQEGQVLVVPKREVKVVWDLDDEEYSQLMLVAKKVAGRLREVFSDKLRIGVHIEGLDVDHAHVKVFPFTTHSEFFNTPSHSSEPDHKALAELAKRLAF